MARKPKKMSPVYKEVLITGTTYYVDSEADDVLHEDTIVPFEIRRPLSKDGKKTYRIDYGLAPEPEDVEDAAELAAEIVSTIRMKEITWAKQRRRGETPGAINVGREGKRRRKQIRDEHARAAAQHWRENELPKIRAEQERREHRRQQRRRRLRELRDSIKRVG